MKEAAELRNPTEMYFAQPLDVIVFDIFFGDLFVLWAYFLLDFYDFYEMYRRSEFFLGQFV